MPTRTAAPNATAQPPVIRSERYRVRFDHRGQAALCAQTAGANRFVWNLFLAYNDWSYRMARKARGYGRWTDFPEAQRPLLVDPGRTWQTMYKRFAALRRGCFDREFQAFLQSPEGSVYADRDLSWLRDLPSAPVRHVLKYLDAAYRRFYKAHAAARAEGVALPRRKSDGKPKYFPRRKGRQGGKADGFTIPDQVRMDGHRLHIPRIGWVRLDRGHARYRGCRAKTVRVRKEGTERHPKWYATVVYEVPAALLKPPARNGAVGLDRNVGQATDSEGEVYAQPDMAKLDANIKRKERKAAKARERSRQSGQPLSNRGRRICGQLRKLHRKQKRRRENAAHQHSRQLADRAHTVVIEDLNTQGMTRSAKGTAGKPGTNVKQKAGLNRGILASGWGRLERHLDYKAGLVVRVDPAYTSQTCAACGHVGQANRKTQALFQCTACGHTANADRNAAVNILARGLPLVRQARGAGASARREAIPLGTSTTREPGRRGPVHQDRTAYRMSTIRYTPLAILADAWCPDPPGPRPSPGWRDMRILVLSDIHANFAALEAVIARTRDHWDELWCLGDIVGYGPRPNECVDLIRAQASLCVPGNHDRAVLDDNTSRQFNDMAREAIDWTRAELTTGNSAYLESLLPEPVPVDSLDLLATHASPRDPVFEYMDGIDTALANWRRPEFAAKFCLVGHTHLPDIFRLRVAQVDPDDADRREARVERMRARPGTPVNLQSELNHRVILNPGSVGQPRDKNKRASFALLVQDGPELIWHYERTDYPIELTQTQMQQAGLPRILIDRLSYGW